MSSVFSVQVKMQKSLLCAWLRQKLCHCQNEKKSSDLSSNSSSFERTQSVRKVRKRLKRKYSQPTGGSSPSDTSSDTKRIHAYSVPNVSEIDSVCYDNVWISSGSLIVSFFSNLLRQKNVSWFPSLKIPVLTEFELLRVGRWHHWKTPTMTSTSFSKVVPACSIRHSRE